MAKKAKFYVVWSGRKTGIFRSWEECASQVSGFPGAAFKSFENLFEAETALAQAYEDHVGRKAPGKTEEELGAIGRPRYPSYAVDASCIGYPGPVEFRCVDTQTREELFRQGPFAHGTNNIGEFLGLVQALAELARRGITVPVYSDSRNAIAWVHQGQCKTKLERTERSEALFRLVDRAEQWLAANRVANPILKWETKAWGENPADYGRK